MQFHRPFHTLIKVYQDCSKAGEKEGQKHTEGSDKLLGKDRTDPLAALHCQRASKPHAWDNALNFNLKLGLEGPPFCTKKRHYAHAAG